MRCLSTIKPMMAVVVLGCTLVTGCSTPPDKQQIGLVTGGVAGAAIGSLFGGGSGKVVATAVGAVGGALIGSEIGKSMDQKDKQNTTVSMNNGAQETSWKNATTGKMYTVTPDPTMYVNNDKLVCRNFDISMSDQGNSNVATTSGSACQNPQTSAWNVA